MAKRTAEVLNRKGRNLDRRCWVSGRNVGGEAARTELAPQRREERRGVGEVRNWSSSLRLSGLCGVKIWFFTPHVDGLSVRFLELVPIPTPPLPAPHLGRGARASGGVTEWGSVVLWVQPHPQKPSWPFPLGRTQQV